MSLLGSLFGGSSGGSPIQGVLEGLLGGGQQGGSSGQDAGGLGGLLSMFNNAGLGHVAQSWIGDGANHPVQPEQLESAFGSERIDEMAQQSGMERGSFLSQLSQHLPSAVDHITPEGRLPDEGTYSV